MTIVDREYKNGVSADAIFFVGEEVEHSPARGMRTLFVVGLQKVEYIHAAAMSHGCEHIYFGANQSFNGSNLETWTAMIRHMLKEQRTKTGKQYLCTLDFDVRHVEEILDTGLCERNNFIPMISVKMPYADQLGYNATVKIDDTDFGRSNPGVWCHELRSLMARRKFTGWHEYSSDEVVE